MAATNGFEAFIRRHYDKLIALAAAAALLLPLMSRVLNSVTAEA